MMATKPMATLRGRGLSPSSPINHSSSASRAARPSTKTPLPGRANVSPPSNKAMPSYTKPKAAPSSEPSPRRSFTAPSTTTNASSKTQSAGRSANQAQLPSNPPVLQKSLNSFSPALKLSSISSIETVTRSAKTSPVSKAKSTNSAPVKKKEFSVIIPAPFLPVNLPSVHEAAVVIEKSKDEQSQNNPKKLVEVLNMQNVEEETKFNSSLVEEDNHVEKLKGGDPELRKELLEPQQLNEISKQLIVLEEFPKKAKVVMDGEISEKTSEVDKVDVVTRLVQPDVRKSKLGAAVSTMVALRTPSWKNKVAPRNNDVIEETKSKLMVTKKNRVLALVGAFETVMSQQEPDSQPIQKVLQVQNCPQIQQVEQSLENQRYLLCDVNQQKQEEEDCLMVKQEVANEALESGVEGEMDAKRLRD